jgi:hypothetical protein
MNDHGAYDGKILCVSEATHDKPLSTAFARSAQHGLKTTLNFSVLVAILMDES